MNRLFRKATFGGFNKEDVMQYIETMKTEFYDYKAQVEETIRELNEKLQSFEQTGDAADGTAVVSSAVSGDPAMSINEATNHLKQVADELCEKMNRLIGSLPQQKAEPDAKPEAPKTAEDRVDALLQNLFQSEKEEKAKQTTPANAKLSIADVLPAYLK